MLRFLHAADFHLDSPFAGLPPRLAAQRRRELRELPERLLHWTEEHPVDLVLLSGDLLDGANVYRDTAEVLRDALGRMDARVFIAPGNHDWYGPGSPWAELAWPENVHIFTSARVESVELPELNAVVHGAAFTAAEQTESLLKGFRAPADGRAHLMVLHGELDGGGRYNPVPSALAAESGLHYLALGHIHRRDIRYTGQTLCAWPGCPEGRGFDETGERGFYAGELEAAGRVSLEFVPFARRRCEILEADVTGRPPLEAVTAALPADTADHLYRILLTGETGPAGGEPERIREALADRFFTLEVRDCTRMAEDVWARAEEDSLRGLFLRELRSRLEGAATEEERQTIQRAARYGLAALDRRDLG